MNGITSRGTSGTLSRIATVLVLALVFALLVTGKAAQASEWRFSITPYAWATDVGVDARLDGRQVVDKKIPVSDLLDDLDLTVQMRVEAQRGEIGLGLDLFDVELSDETKGVALPQGAGQADLKSDIGMTILDVTGVYDPKGDRRGFALVYGTRIIDERSTVDATFLPAPGVAVAQSYETSDTYVDGLLGLRYTKLLSRHWACQARADVSAGGTDYTYSAGPSISYAFGKFGQFGISAGYRYMKVDFEDQDGLDTKLTLSGALIGLRTSF